MAKVKKKWESLQIYKSFCRSVPNPVVKNVATLDCLCSPWQLFLLLTIPTVKWATSRISWLICPHLDSYRNNRPWDCKYEHLRVLFSQWGVWVLGREGGIPTEINSTHLLLDSHHRDQCPIEIRAYGSSPPPIFLRWSGKARKIARRQTIKVWRDPSALNLESVSATSCQHRNPILQYHWTNKSSVAEHQQNFDTWHSTAHNIENIDLALVFSPSRRWLTEWQNRFGIPTMSRWWTMIDRLAIWWNIDVIVRDSQRGRHLGIAKSGVCWFCFRCNRLRAFIKTCVVFLAKKTRRAMSKQRLLSKPDKSPTTVAAQNTFKQNIVTFSDAFPIQNGWIFGKVPNSLWPPPPSFSESYIANFFWNSWPKYRL